MGGGPLPAVCRGALRPRRLLALLHALERRGQAPLLVNCARATLIATTAVWAGSAGRPGVTLKQAARVDKASGRRRTSGSPTPRVSAGPSGRSKLFRLLLGLTLSASGVAIARTGIVYRWLGFDRGPQRTPLHGDRSGGRLQRLRAAGRPRDSAPIRDLLPRSARGRCPEARAHSQRPTADRSATHLIHRAQAGRSPGAPGGEAVRRARGRGFHSARARPSG